MVHQCNVVLLTVTQHVPLLGQVNTKERRRLGKYFVQFVRKTKQNKIASIHIKKKKRAVR